MLELYHMTTILCLSSFHPWKTCSTHWHSFTNLPESSNDSFSWVRTTFNGWETVRNVSLSVGEYCPLSGAWDCTDVMREILKLIYCGMMAQAIWCSGTLFLGNFGPRNPVPRNFVPPIFFSGTLFHRDFEHPAPWCSASELWSTISLILGTLILGTMFHGRIKVPGNNVPRIKVPDFGTLFLGTLFPRTLILT